MNGRLLLKPGFPEEWEYASLHTPDIDFDFKAGEAATGKYSSRDCSLYTVTHRLPAVRNLELQFPARRSAVARLTVNGQNAAWRLVENSVGRPMLSVSVPAASDEEVTINVAWEGELLEAPASVDAYPATRVRKAGPVSFIAMEQGQMKWWAPVEHPVSDKGKKPVPAGDFKAVDSARCTPVDMQKVFNANVTDIFRNEYLSPRSPYTTLQLPKQGIGEWCHPLKTADIDDSGLRAAVRKGLLETKLGIPFRTPAEGHNIAFTSLWDNYPDSLQIPLQGKASRAYLLMAGSTNHMQCHIDNGVIRVYYEDGTCDTLSLVNPDNWPPIEQIFFEDGKSFNRHAPSLYRLRLKTGELSNNFGEELGFTGVSREVDGGAAVLLEMPLNAGKKLSHLVLETLSNEVVIGIMGITLQR